MSHECRCGEVDSVGGVIGARESQYPMVEVADALASVLAAVTRATQQQRHTFVPIASALGCIVAQARHATDPFPPFACSIMDGYAVVAADGVGTFDIAAMVTAGPAKAGAPDMPAITRGQVAYITTGAPLPEGADAVVPIEWTKAAAGSDTSATRVRIVRAVEPGTNVRPIGCDITPGQALLHAGQVVGPAEIGLMAAVGTEQVLVVAPPTVGILSTGDEIAPFQTEQDDLAYGQIRDSNGPMLVALATKAGARTIALGQVTDVEHALEQKVLAALDQVDMLVLSGGVSMGSLDLLKPLLERLGTVVFGRLNMKPGKPTTLMIRSGGREKIVFGLPGNPVSALVTAQLLVVPAIQAWMRGAEGITAASHGYPVVPVRLVERDLARDPTRPEYHRLHVRFDPATMEWLGTSTGSQMSSRLLSVCASNGLTLVPKGEGAIGQGTVVPTMLVGEWNLPRVAQSAPAAAPSGPASNPAGASSASTVATSASSSSPSPPPFDLLVSILTVSDRCSRGSQVDLSGPAIVQLLERLVLKGVRLVVHQRAIVPDEAKDIRDTIERWCDAPEGAPHLLLTTGGTGFSSRDITPDVVRPLLDKEASGFVHAMLQASFKATPMAALSRPIAGSRRRTLILTLPGSPKAIPEILEPIMPMVPHACRLLRDEDSHVVPKEALAQKEKLASQ